MVEFQLPALFARQRRHKSMVGKYNWSFIRDRKQVAYIREDKQAKKMPISPKQPLTDGWLPLTLDKATDFTASLVGLLERVEVSIPSSQTITVQLELAKMMQRPQQLSAQRHACFITTSRRSLTKAGPESKDARITDSYSTQVLDQSRSLSADLHEHGVTTACPHGRWIVTVGWRKREPRQELPIHSLQSGSSSIMLNSHAASRSIQASLQSVTEETYQEEGMNLISEIDLEEEDDVCDFFEKLLSIS